MIERVGIRIGLIGLVEKCVVIYLQAHISVSHTSIFIMCGWYDSYREWIGTVSAWPENFEYRNMVEVGMDLSRRLRDPNGEYKCDVVIALTHARYVSNPLHDT